MLGNEPNHPAVAWRDNPQRFYEASVTAKKTLETIGAKNVLISLPGLAHYGGDEYLAKLIKEFTALSYNHTERANPPFLPVDIVSDHFYGSIQDLLPRIMLMRARMKKEGIGDKKYFITEIGNPKGDFRQNEITNQELAECYIPQVLSLAVGSQLVDRIFYYSLYDATNAEHSLAKRQDGKLEKTPAYTSWSVMTRLLARTNHISLTQERNHDRVDGKRRDGIHFSVLWATHMEEPAYVPIPKDAKVFSALGQELKERSEETLLLPPPSRDSLGGPAAIFLSHTDSPY